MIFPTQGSIYWRGWGGSFSPKCFPIALQNNGIEQTLVSFVGNAVKPVQWSFCISEGSNIHVTKQRHLSVDEF